MNSSIWVEVQRNSGFQIPSMDYSGLTQNEDFYIHVYLIRDKVYIDHYIFRVIYNPCIIKLISKFPIFKIV